MALCCLRWSIDRISTIRKLILTARCGLALLSILQLIFVLLFFINGSYTDKWAGAGAIVITVAVDFPERLFS